MELNIIINKLEDKSPSEQPVEIVERKGQGHPDTLCDIAVEKASVAISKLYISEFGKILHYNLDKALLVGGSSRVSYGGGEIIEPIEFVVAGRATKEFNGRIVPVDEVVADTIKKYFSRTLRYLDTDIHLRINVKIRPGSTDLTELFKIQDSLNIPLSNDTSIGTGFYPLDESEEITRKIEEFLNGDFVKTEHPYVGEDIKVMCFRMNDIFNLTVAVAIIDRYVKNLEDYSDKIKQIEKLIKQQTWYRPEYKIYINTADDPKQERIYLTVTGTSAESGDDGEVGRGNRSNGLITPYRPMTMEAVAGKNPVNHVGKIYNLFSGELSRSLVKLGYCNEAYVNIVSQIGKPITLPQVLEIKLRGQSVKNSVIEEAAVEMIDKLPNLWKRILNEEFEIA